SGSSRRIEHSELRGMRSCEYCTPPMPRRAAQPQGRGPLPGRTAAALFVAHDLLHLCDDLRRHLLHAVNGPGMLGRHPQRLLLVRCPDLFRAVEADILAANHLGHGKLLLHDDGRAHTTSRVISGMTTWSDTSSYPWLRSCLAMSFALN